MEYIPGEQLSTAWKSYSESEKSAVTHKIAETIVNMAEITFDSIGGMTLAHTLGPTVEGHKLFKGRDKFHSPSCYDIGPYSSTRSYVLACYAKEIYYYTHAPDSDIDMDLFDETPKDAFIKSLQSTHDEIASNPSCFLPEEPFVLNHGDFNGRNILEQGTEIRAIIDWEFAGSYPLSELLDGSVFNVVEVESEEDADENFKWDDRIVALVAEVARGRGWDERKVDLLVNHHNRELQAARMEMFPGGFDDEQEEDPEEEREDESP